MAITTTYLPKCGPNTRETRAAKSRLVELHERLKVQRRELVATILGKAAA